MTHTLRSGPYEPGAPLLRGTYRTLAERDTAALSVAANRASKVRLLRDEGHHDRADRAYQYLRAAVLDYVRDDAPSDQTIDRLRAIVEAVR